MPEHAAGPAAWARWAGDAEPPWTVGVEEELMLLDPDGHGLVNRVDDVLEALPAAVAEHTAPETHACVLERRTSPHATVAQAALELGGLREQVDGVLREELGLCAAVAGLHPAAGRGDAELSTHPRHREVAATTRALSRREPTMAQHVHVAVPARTWPCARSTGCAQTCP